jgi:hypothetical protein
VGFTLVTTIDTLSMLITGCILVMGTSMSIIILYIFGLIGLPTGIAISTMAYIIAGTLVMGLTTAGTLISTIIVISTINA